MNKKQKQTIEKVNLLCIQLYIGILRPKIEAHEKEVIQ